ncbi:MAG: hypothetical protein NTX40_00285 [Planctomycetota bacterium]|nr:hypothetical protein [Planctomycetota bacterium]
MKQQATSFSGPWILAVVVLSVSLGGCAPEPQFEVFVTPDSAVAAGGNALVGVRVTNPPQGLRLHAIAERGVCEPSEDMDLSSRYTAPQEAGEDRVTLEVRHGAKTLFSKALLLTILPPRSGSPPPVPSPEIKIVTVRAIKMTTVPPYSEHGGAETAANIAGKTSGVDPSLFRVVVYVLTNAWYVQPLIESPGTEIAPDGSWGTWTHTGTQYAALVVRRGFKPPAQTPVLPSLGDDVVAITVVEGRR